VGDGVLQQILRGRGQDRHEDVLGRGLPRTQQENLAVQHEALQGCRAIALVIFLLVKIIFFVSVAAEECGSVLQNPDVLPDRNVTASSSATNGNNHYWNSVHLPHNGRLFGSRGVGGWAAGKKEVGEWIQVDYGKNMTMTGVATQGRGNDNFKQWVTEYTVSYKADGSSTFETIKDGCEKAMVFKGNDDKVEIVVNKLPRPITARYFRINPIAWNGWIVMRFDFLNC